MDNFWFWAKHIIHRFQQDRMLDSWYMVAEALRVQISTAYSKGEIDAKGEKALRDLIDYELFDKETEIEA